MFEPEAFFSDVNNLLGITGINQKIIDICNDRALCSKIKGNVQTYLDNNPYKPINFSKELLDKWIIDYGIDYIADILYSNGNNQLQEYSTPLKIIYNKLSNKKKSDLDSPINYQDFLAYLSGVIAIVKEQLYTSLPTQFKVLNRTLKDHIDESLQDVRGELVKLVEFKKDSTTISTNKVISDSQIYQCVKDTALKMLDRAKTEQGRMKAFDNEEEKINIPDIGNAISKALGKSNDLLKDSNVVGEGESGRSLVSFYESNELINTLLIGGGGSGKTFMLLDLAEKLNDSQIDIIPVYVPLNILNEKVFGENKNPILNYFINNSNTSCKKQLLQWLRNVKETTVLFLLDGYNEITLSESKMNIISEIKELNRDFKSVSFIITSRNDISECFSTGGSLPFQCKRVNPLNDESIKEYLDCVLCEIDSDRLWETIIGTKFIDILRSPMALAMYRYILDSNENISSLNLNLPYDSPETLGELIGDFVAQIQQTPCLQNETIARNDINQTMLILYYIGYKMVKENRFRVLTSDLERYVQEGTALFSELVSYRFKEYFYQTFLNIESLMGFIVYPKTENEDCRFYHQNFRDYFYAKFLYQIILFSISQNCGTFIITYFSENIPNDVLVLLGEITQERLFKPNGKEQNSENGSLIERALALLYENFHNIKCAEAVKNLVNVAKLTRDNNLSTFNFSGLDLNLTTLNMTKLSTLCIEGKLKTANFNQAYLTEETFQSSGHSAAIHTMCRVDNNLLSISAGGIWAYNLDTGSFKILSTYKGEQVMSSVYSKKTGRLLTGDRNGTFCVWDCSIDNGNIIICLKHSCNLKGSVQQILSTDNQDVFFISVIDGSIYRFDSRSENDFSLVFRFVQLERAKCKMVYDYDRLYCSYGKQIRELVFDHNFMVIQNNLWHEIKCMEDAYIYDIKKTGWNDDLELIINIRGITKSVIELVSESESVIIADNAHDHNKRTDKFIGFNNIAVSCSGCKFVLTSNSQSKSMPNIYEYSRTNMISNDFNLQVYYGKQIAEVEDALYLDDNKIITCSVDRSLQIIDTKNELVSEYLPGHYHGIHTLDVISENEIYLASYSGSISCWKKVRHMYNWKCKKVFQAHDDWIWDLKHYFYNKVLYVAASSYDQSISIWNTSNEMLVCKIPMNGRVLSIEFTNNGNLWAITDLGIIEIYKIDFINNRFYKLCHADLNKQFNCKCRKLKIINDSLETTTALVLAETTKNRPIVINIKILGKDKLQITECTDISGLVPDSVFLRAIDVLDSDRNRTYLIAGNYDDEKKSEFALVYDGTNNHSVLANDRENENNSGISACILFNYKNNLYAATTAYSYSMCIYRVEENCQTVFLKKLTHDDQLLDVKFLGSTLFSASLSGKVFSWDFDKVIASEKSNLNFMDSDFCKAIIQNMSGFNMVDVDFLNSDTTMWSDDFRQKIEQYSKRYNHGGCNDLRIYH